MINPVKGQFGLRSIFLGHSITCHGAQPLPEKVDAIRRFPRPPSVKSLQEFIGMVNFYHRFVPSAAGIMRPLFQCLAGKPKYLVWSMEAGVVFEGANTL